MKAKTIALALILSTWTLATEGPANEPRWTGPVVARGQTRQEIETTPMVHRPYRPFHFYGNTMRRQYYRGWPTPLPRDVFGASRALVFRR
jgi:hypothetical protein